MAFKLSTELIWIRIMTGFAGERSGKVKTIFARVAVVGTVSAFVSILAAVGVMLNNTLGEAFGVVGTGVIVTNADVVWIRKSIAFVGSWDVNTVLVNSAVIVS